MPPVPRPQRFGFLDHPLPIAFAHRGGALEAEENTMAAFSNAVKLGYHYVETDVQASRDGVAVVFHDDRLDRLTGNAGSVGDFSWAELTRLTTRGGERLCRLDELFGTFPRLRVNVEPKSDAAVAPMADAIRRCAAIERVCVGSFDQQRTMRARQLLGEGLCWSPSRAGVARLFLAGYGVPLSVPDFPAVQIPPRWHGIQVPSRRFVAAAHARGVQVHVWSIDREDEMQRLLDTGVDGLMSDRPSVLKTVLLRRGQWTGD